MNHHPYQRAFLRVLERHDFITFLQLVFEQVSPGERFEPTLAVEAIAYALDQVRLGRRRRQVIAVPPRSLKSICASVALPAFILGHRPTAKIICVSYSGELAAKHSADCRAVMKSAWYRALFPRTRISADKDTESYFRTTAGGYRDATSVGGTLTGKGGDLIIVDDALKPQDALSEVQRERVNNWYSGTLISRLNNKGKDAIVIVMQRLHVDDLIGHVTRREKWHQLILPAVAEDFQVVEKGRAPFIRFPGHVLDPAREPLHILEQMKREMPAADFAAQYQQNPVQLEGDLVSWSWFGTFDEVPEGTTYSQSWDFASKDTEFSAYSVCTTWAEKNGQHYLLHVFRKRLSAAEMLRAVVEEAQRWPLRELLIEDAAAGTFILSQLRFERPSDVPGPIGIMPEGDKVTRFHNVSTVIEQGRVFLKEGAPWLNDLQTELALFPRGKFSDQVDSISQYLARAEKRRLNPCRVQRKSMFFD